MELKGYGNDLVNILEQLLKEELFDKRDARHIPALLKSMGATKSVPFLLSLVEKFYPNDLILRKETFRALNTLKRNHPRLKFPMKRIHGLIFREISSVQLVMEASALQRKLLIAEVDEISAAREGLVKLLTRRQAGNVSRLFRLLGLLYPVSDIIPIYRAITEKGGAHRSSALELLDNLLKPKLRKRIIPVLEQLFIKTEKKYGPSPSSADRGELQAAQVKSFELLLLGDDPRLKLAVLYLIGRLGERRCIPMLTARLKDADERVAAQVRKTLTRFT